MATWCWGVHDVATRRLAAVQLVEAASASRRAVASAFFRYMRAHFALDGLDSYAKVVDDLERTVPNPEKNKAGARAGDARAKLTDTETTYPGTDLTLVYSVKGF